MKYLLIYFEGGLIVIVYFGMFGLFCIEVGGELVMFGDFYYVCLKDEKYDYVVFYFVCGNEFVCIIYNDFCCFGFFLFEEIVWLFEYLFFVSFGLEFIGNSLSVEVLVFVFVDKKVLFKVVLFD